MGSKADVGGGDAAVSEAGRAIDALRAELKAQEKPVEGGGSGCGASEISHAEAPAAAADRPLCDARSEREFVCTLELGHAGEHVAMAGVYGCIDKWSDQSHDRLSQAAQASDLGDAGASPAQGATPVGGCDTGTVPNWRALVAARDRLRGVILVALKDVTDSFCEWCERHAPKDDDGRVVGPIRHGLGCWRDLAETALMASGKSGQPAPASSVTEAGAETAAAGTGGPLEVPSPETRGGEVRCDRCGESRHVGNFGEPECGGTLRAGSATDEEG